MVVFLQYLIQGLITSCWVTDSVAVHKCSASLTDLGKETGFSYLMSKFQAAPNSNGSIATKEDTSLPLTS